MELNRCDYVILAILNSKGATATMYGQSIYEIKDSEKISKIGTIYKEVKKLQKFGYVAEGVKAGRAKTYYLTKEGINMLPAKTKKGENQL